MLDVENLEDARLELEGAGSRWDCTRRQRRTGFMIFQLGGRKFRQ
jgi:hypothetical protein